MFNDNGKAGSICKHCLKVWDHEGKPFAQTYDSTSWVNDGYKLVVCENCLSKRACERYASAKSNSEALRPPSKELLDREYRELREIIPLGTKLRWANGFDAYGILRDA